jgi:DNA-binding MarR family transcriptional regulator
MASLIEDLGLTIKKIQHRHHRSMDERLHPLGITFVQWNALREISRHPGQPLHHLAQATFNSDQAFGTLAARLVDRGYVTRHEGKGRAIIHELTPVGSKLLRQGNVSMLDMLRKSFGSLRHSEQRALSVLLQKVLDAGEGHRTRRSERNIED